MLPGFTALVVAREYIGGVLVEEEDDDARSPSGAIVKIECPECQLLTGFGVLLVTSEFEEDECGGVNVLFDVLLALGAAVHGNLPEYETRKHSWYFQVSCRRYVLILGFVENDTNCERSLQRVLVHR